MTSSKNIRTKIWFNLLKILKFKEGDLIPKWLYPIRFLLFPVDYVCHLCSECSGYDFITDVWTIEGVKYSGNLMRHFGYGKDELFKIIKRENGVITIEKINV